MEGTMEQFTEKLAGLVELGKKNKNFLEYAQIDSYFSASVCLSPVFKSDI